MVEHGLASRADVEAMAAAFRAWGAHPDALWAFTHIAALGSKARARPKPSRMAG